MSESQFHSTTICAIEKDGKLAMAGDGQVTMGEQVIMKGTARKVRRIYNGKVVVGFAGSVADAFTLEEKFEGKLNEYNGSRRTCTGMADTASNEKPRGIIDCHE